MPQYNPAGGVDNDGRFPDESTVAVRYPAPGALPVRLPGTGLEDRAAWPWLPGTILAQCGPEEWRVAVEVRELATLGNGTPAPEDTADEDLYYPVCFRNPDELRSVEQGGVDAIAQWQTAQREHAAGRS